MAQTPGSDPGSDPGLGARLPGSWVHAHEQDDGGDQVFVPAGTPLPPSRGRTAFTLGADGRASQQAPGPDDRRVAQDGTWDLQGDRLSVRPQGYLEGRGSLLYDVQSVTADRLVVRPVLTT